MSRRHLLASMKLGEAEAPSFGLIEDATDDSIALNSSPEIVSNLSCVTFGDSFSKIYVGTFSSDIVYQYSGTAGTDINGYSYDSKSFDFTAQEGNLRSIKWKFDGTKCYIVGNTSNTVYQYSASTAWDISSVSYDSVSFAVGFSPAYELVFKPDGTEMFVNTEGIIRAFTLSPAWDITSATLNYSSIIGATNTVGMYMNPNGLQILQCNSTTSLLQKNYTVAWDFTVLATTTSSLVTTAIEGQLTCMATSEDATKLYIGGRATEDMNQLSFN